MKKIRVKNEMEEAAVALPMDLGEGSDEDDEVLGRGDVKMAGVPGEEEDEDSEGLSFLSSLFFIPLSLSLPFLSFPCRFESALTRSPIQSTKISKLLPIPTAEDQEMNQETEMMLWMERSNQRRRRLS